MVNGRVKIAGNCELASLYARRSLNHGKDHHHGVDYVCVSCR